MRGQTKNSKRSRAAKYSIGSVSVQPRPFIVFPQLSNPVVSNRGIIQNRNWKGSRKSVQQAKGRDREGHLPDEVENAASYRMMHFFPLDFFGGGSRAATMA